MHLEEPRAFSVHLVAILLVMVLSTVHHVVLVDFQPLDPHHVSYAPSDF